MTTTTENKSKAAEAPQSADKKPALHDQFGFGLDTQNNKFGKMLLAEGGCTMREVRDAKWNTKGVTFYNAFGTLVEKGLAEKRDDRMRAVQTKGGK